MLKNKISNLKSSQFLNQESKDLLKTLHDDYCEGYKYLFNDLNAINESYFKKTSEVKVLRKNISGKYLEDNDICRFFNSGKVLIVAPTGSGKSTTVVNTCLKNKTPIIYLFSNVSQVKEYEEKYKNEDFVKCLYGDMEVNKEDLFIDKILIMTYEKFANNNFGSGNPIYKTIQVVIDEAHTVFSEAAFRSFEKLMKKASGVHQNVVFLTGTPQHIYFPGVNRVVIYKYKDQKEINLKNIKVHKRAIFSVLSDEIVQVIDKKEQVLCLLNNTTHQEKLKNLLQVRGFNVLSINKNDGFDEIVKKGNHIDDYDVILTTVYIKSGVSLYSNREVHVFNCIEHACPSDDICQIIERVRTNKQNNISMFFVTNDVKEKNTQIELDYLNSISSSLSHEDFHQSILVYKDFIDSNADDSEKRDGITFKPFSYEDIHSEVKRMNECIAEMKKIGGKLQALRNTKKTFWESFIEESKIDKDLGKSFGFEEGKINTMAVRGLAHKSSLEKLSVEQLKDYYTHAFQFVNYKIAKVENIVHTEVAENEFVKNENQKVSKDKKSFKEKVYSSQSYQEISDFKTQAINSKKSYEINVACKLSDDFKSIQDKLIEMKVISFPEQKIVEIIKNKDYDMLMKFLHNDYRTKFAYFSPIINSALNDGFLQEQTNDLIGKTIDKKELKSIYQRIAGVSKVNGFPNLYKYSHFLRDIRSLYVIKEFIDKRKRKMTFVKKFEQQDFVNMYKLNECPGYHDFMNQLDIFQKEKQRSIDLKNQCEQILNKKADETVKVEKEVVFVIDEDDEFFEDPVCID